jgi:hypothetical protein
MGRRRQGGLRTTRGDAPRAVPWTRQSTGFRSPSHQKPSQPRIPFWRPLPFRLPAAARLRRHWPLAFRARGWSTVQRDELVHAAHQAGVSKNRIHAITGIARTTIDRVLETPVGAPRQRVTAYLEKFTGEWPRYGRAWYGQRVMASAYTAEQIASALLADPGFRGLKLGTWLSIPSRELITEAVAALSSPLFQQDVDLLVEALLLAAQKQQEEARQGIAFGLLGGAALAIALRSSRGA